MNLDKLISKYLDGELTAGEDLQLRKLISSDGKARDKFNSYVDIHLAAKEDAKSIETPQDLKEETEDIVLMKIMGQAPDMAKPSMSSRLMNKFPNQLVSMVAVLLMISIYNISDINIFDSEAENMYSPAELELQVPSVNNNTVNNEILESGNERNIALTGNNDNQQKRKQVQISEADVALESDSDNGKDLITRSNNDESELLLSYNNSSIDEEIEETEKSKKNNDLEFINSTSSSMNAVEFTDFGNRINKQKQADIPLNNIELSAYSSRPFKLTGFDNSANASMSTFSQSVSIPINQKSRIGLELGYSDISYIGEIKIYYNEQDKYGRETGVQTVTSRSMEKDYSLYWGQMFFQTEIMTYKNLDMSLRLGAGFSDEGINSNSKLTASYEIINGLKLTAGTELGYFNVSLPQLINSNSGHYISFSTVYGIQFNF